MGAVRAALRRMLSTADTPDWRKLPSGLFVQEGSLGEGAAAEVGSLVTIHYSTIALNSGKLLECTYQSGQPFVFRAGLGEAMPGLDEGVLGMCVGGRRALCVPGYLAYGRFGSPPDASLVVDVELVDVRS
jgi:peptidylprolyl isomerase